MSILVTGGAGFIGSNFILNCSNDYDEPLINLDKLTYASNLENLSPLKNNDRYIFIQGDIGNEKLTKEILETYRPRFILNFAAESHVDRSIHYPENFIETNILGTFRLLKSVQSYWEKNSKHDFRFIHISTDEVYGSLSIDDPPFTESSPYCPSGPYSASKASSDHLVRAYHHTYGLPAIITNCSNNYGPRQHLEKLIPLVIHNALSGKDIPLYGDGKQIRDWLYVLDHCEAIRVVLEKGKIGETYNIGGNCEKTNLDVVNTICSLLDQKRPRPASYKDQIRFVKDRPGHDRRYAIACTKIPWTPRETFESGMEKTIEWYLNNSEWMNQTANKSYQNWVQQHYR